MNSIIYNKLILRLHGNESVGAVLTDPQLSKYDITKAVTQGSPIVRLKLLNHFLDHPHHGGDVSAFFEQEAHNINFGQTALKWVEAFPRHSNIIFEKMCQFHQTGWINDDLYSQMERAWLEANVATTPATSVKRKM